jgi:hypothetical protein
MPEETILLCEKCGRPATNSTLDAVEFHYDLDGMKHSKPSGGYHIRCDEHRHETDYIDVSMSPAYQRGL